MIRFLLSLMAAIPLWLALGMFIGGIMIMILFLCTSDRMEVITQFHEIEANVQQKKKELKKLQNSITWLKTREKKVVETKAQLEQYRQQLDKRDEELDDFDNALAQKITEYDQMYGQIEQFPAINSRVENELRGQIAAKQPFALALKRYLRTVGLTGNYLQNQEVKQVLISAFNGQPTQRFVEQIYSALIGQGVPGVVAAWLLYRSLSGVN